MSIKSNYEQIIKNLEAEREREVASIKDKVMREKIVPFNQEMDIARDKAVAEKQQELNNDVAAMQEKFTKEKQEIFAAAEKKKADNAASVLATETYVVTGKYDKEISNLKERVANLEE
jgi:metal-dependent hydrolase (beta-lactamase superfamily II)